MYPKTGVVQEQVGKAGDKIAFSAYKDDLFMKTDGIKAIDTLKSCGFNEQYSTNYSLENRSCSVCPDNAPFSVGGATQKCSSCLTTLINESYSSYEQYFYSQVCDPSQYVGSSTEGEVSQLYQRTVVPIIVVIVAVGLIGTIIGIVCCVNIQKKQAESDRKSNERWEELVEMSIKGSQIDELRSQLSMMSMNALRQLSVKGGSEAGEGADVMNWPSMLAPGYKSNQIAPYNSSKNKDGDGKADIIVEAADEEAQVTSFSPAVDGTKDERSSFILPPVNKEKRLTGP